VNARRYPELLQVLQCRFVRRLLVFALEAAAMDDGLEGRDVLAPDVRRRRDDEEPNVLLVFSTRSPGK
jgi:hypothetical protein